MDAIEKYVKDIEWIKKKLESMDDIANPIMGIRDWDDAACIEFKGRLLASTDGPYTKRLVMKSALIHAATDVVVKGGRPLFALDSIIGPRADVEEMVDSLKTQAELMRIPILGGNTLFEEVEPRCSITVVGELLTKEPIRDCGAQKGDVIALVGEPLWGEQTERLEKANVLFETWFEALGKVKFNSAKDVTKGGLVSVVYEMEAKSGRKFQLTDVPYPMARNLDNFIVTLSELEYINLEKTCMKHKCKMTRIGVVE
ncbi:MAG: AIR synthase related protein [Candidatus Altiarchaeota archaeon]